MRFTRHLSSSRRCVVLALSLTYPDFSRARHPDEPYEPAPWYASRRNRSRNGCDRTRRSDQLVHLSIRRTTHHRQLAPPAEPKPFSSRSENESIRDRIFFVLVVRSTDLQEQRLGTRRTSVAEEHLNVVLRVHRIETAAPPIGDTE